MPQKQFTVWCKNTDELLSPDGQWHSPRFLCGVWSKQPLTMTFFDSVDSAQQAIEQQKVLDVKHKQKSDYEILEVESQEWTVFNTKSISRK